MQARAQFEHHLLTLLRHRPGVDAKALHALQALCSEQSAHAPEGPARTLWRLIARYLQGLTHTPQLDPDRAALAAPMLQGVRALASAQPESALHALNQSLFLDYADVLTRALLSGLTSCQQHPDVWPSGLHMQAQQLMNWAHDMGEDGLADMARALRSQLQRLETERSASDVQTSVRGVQELMRLLHQFAAGATAQPHTAVRDALDASG